MKLVKTFPQGGIHPQEYKEMTEALAITNAGIPSLSIVPLLQHLGSPAECLVSPGDIVREETLIGKSTGFVSTNIHSPVPGRVKELREIYLPNAVKTTAVVMRI